MNTAQHPEAAGLAEALCNPMCHHEGAYKECDKYAEVALSWFTARLTDDDVVEAAARAAASAYHLPGSLRPDRREARAALSAAAAKIGGEGR